MGLERAEGRMGHKSCEEQMGHRSCEVQRDHRSFWERKEHKIWKERMIYLGYHSLAVHPRRQRMQRRLQLQRILKAFSFFLNCLMYYRFKTPLHI